MVRTCFGCFLELQDFYFDKVVHRATRRRDSGSVASSNGHRASFGELEWEDDYDFGEKQTSKTNGTGTASPLPLSGQSVVKSWHCGVTLQWLAAVSSRIRSAGLGR